MASWKDEPGLRAWSALLRGHASAVRAVDSAVGAATGMPLAWYDVLLELNSAPGRRMRMLDLGEAVVLSRTRVSRIVDEMEASGLVNREANEADRRSAFAALTPEGRKALRRAAPVYLRAIRQHFVAHLVGEEVAVVASALERVAGAGARRSSEPTVSPPSPGR